MEQQFQCYGIHCICLIYKQTRNYNTQLPYIVHVGQYRSFNAEMLYLGLVAIAMVAQLVRSFASHAEDQMFESRSPPTKVIKTVSNRSTAERSAFDVNVKGFRR